MFTLLKWVFIGIAVLAVIQHFNAEDTVGRAVNDTAVFLNDKLDRYLPQESPFAP